MNPVLQCEWSSDEVLPEATEFSRDARLNVQMDEQVVFAAEFAFVVVNSVAGDTPQESGPNNG